MPTFLTIILTASHIALAANRIPEFKVEPSCRAAAEAAVAPNRDAKVCKREELTARGKLNNEWGQFTPTQKAHCTSLSRLGDSPSYIELLTCLELAKAAKGLPPRDHMTGQGSWDWGSVAAGSPSSDELSSKPRRLN
jgi:hypothetical protein